MGSHHSCQRERDLVLTFLATRVFEIEQIRCECPSFSVAYVVLYNQLNAMTGFHETSHTTCCMSRVFSF